MNYKIIILETNHERRDFLRSLISGWGYTPFSFERETICLDNLSSLKPDLVIAGDLPLERTFRFINALKMRNSSLPILIISGDHTIQDFINTNGFDDVLVLKTPIEPYEIKKTIRMSQGNMFKSTMFHDCPLIIGQDSEMLKIKKIIPELGRSKETVLIKGETGTGKELVAKAIHFRSDRRNNPFIKVNSAEFAQKLFESEMFGHSTRSFTDACEDSWGKYDVANTGTIFINEIDKIPATLQAYLLHVLEERGISKFGFEANKQLDVRIIAATDSNLDLLVERGKFRKDLFFRLNVISIEIPPLRNRIEDISLLTFFFIDKFCGEFGKSHYELSKKTKDLLSSYHWPGNVRELKSVVKSFVLEGNEDSITNKLHLYNQKYKSTNFIDCHGNIDTLAELSNVKNYIRDLNKVSLKDICREFITRIEKNIMKKVLEKTNWNRKKAAIILKISYKSMLNKIKAYKLT